MGEPNAIPNPGTLEALAQGCLCPEIDNGHGTGYRGQEGIFVYMAGCPVHDDPTPARQDETDG